MDALKDYPVHISQNVIWGDMDAFNHVNNTVYLRYFEDVRIVCFEKMGVMDYMGLHQIGPIQANVRCDFNLPVTYPDRIHIGGGIKELGAKKFIMTFAVYSENLNAIAAQGEGLVVYYDYTNNRSCNVPEEIVERIRAL